MDPNSPLSTNLPYLGELLGMGLGLGLVVGLVLCLVSAWRS